MDQYAERLRALHRDLTLVLQAVERGLAAAEHPEHAGPPVPAREPIEIVPAPPEHPGPAVAPPATPRSRTPRVEVMPAPSGEQRRADQEERRARPRPENVAPDSDGPDDDERGERLPRPAPRFPARPSAVERSQREPEWVERGAEGFTTPTFPPPGTQQLRVSRALVAGFVVAWLVVVALLIALLVSLS